jgi:hypothetical protein
MISDIRYMAGSEKLIFYCNDYDPEICKKQCMLVSSPFESETEGNCVDGGGKVTWKC